MPVIDLLDIQSQIFGPRFLFSTFCFTQMAIYNVTLKYKCSYKENIFLLLFLFAMKLYCCQLLNYILSTHCCRHLLGVSQRLTVIF